MRIGRDEQSPFEQSPFEQGLDEFMNGGFVAEAERVLDEANKKLGPDTDGTWEIYDAAMAPDFLLSCPCGSVIEQDGECSRGHVSPLRGAGLA